MLGYRHVGFDGGLTRQSLQNDPTKALSVAERFEAFSDFPWALIYRELDRKFQDARFILTVRDSNTWYDSLCRHAIARPNGRIRRLIYGHPMPQGNRDVFISTFEKHNESVKQHFASMADKLLVVSWENGDGWKELCEFLGRLRPKKKFPHANRSRKRA